jgi:hypothetical protein
VRKDITAVGALGLTEQGEGAELGCRNHGPRAIVIFPVSGTRFESKKVRRKPSDKSVAVYDRYREKSLCFNEILNLMGGIFPPLPSGG